MKKIVLEVFLLGLLGHAARAQNEGATEVCLEFYDARNVTVREGETAIFGCPLEDKCLADSVEWFELDANGDRQPLKDSRVEIFSFDPLLMYMTDIEKSDEGIYGCLVRNAQGEVESKMHMKVISVPGYISASSRSIVHAAQEEEVVPAPVNNRNVAVQMSTAVLSPVTETPPETTTKMTTTERSNKWARFQVYSKYRGSRVSFPGAGFGAAYREALAADNITLIPRREEDMPSTTTTTTRRPYWIKTTTTRRPAIPGTTTESPFKLYNAMNREGHPNNLQTTGPNFSQERSGNSGGVWSQGGKSTIPPAEGSHLTNRDHLQAIHEHLRYIYDRLDDLLDRVHYLETKE